MKINFKAAFDTVLKYGSEHKPEITSGAGIVLMVAGTVTAVCATIKTMHAVADAKEDKLLEIAVDAEEYENLPAEKKDEYDDILESPMPIKEVVKVSWKYWIVPFAATGAGIACSVYSDRAWAKKVGLATSALAYQIAEAKDYKSAAKELLGEEKEKEIEEEQTKRTAKRHSKDIENVIDTGTGEQRYKDYYSGIVLKAGPTYIDACLNELNAAINEKQYYIGNGPYSDDAYVKLNDWYDILSPKIGHNGFGDMFGFNVSNGLAQLSYSPVDTEIMADGMSCIILRFRTGNVPDYIDIY